MHFIKIMIPISFEGIAKISQPELIEAIEDRYKQEMRETSSVLYLEGDDKVFMVHEITPGATTPVGLSANPQRN